MDILIIGLNHKTAPIEIREKMAFDGPKLIEALNKLKDYTSIKEHIILSTCNRIEIYAAVDDPDSGADSIKGFISDFQGIARDILDKSLYTHKGNNAIRHIYRVGASLDSMVVGEPQILGQLKSAFDTALQNKTTGVFLNKLMRKAVSVVKRVRTETKIAEGAVSISFAAVELAKKIFEDISTKSFMLIGAGEMAELAAKHLLNIGVKDVYVTNRTTERAEELAKEFNGKVILFDNFHLELRVCDIVISAVTSPDIILKKEDMQRIMKDRKQKPIFIIDIADRRNIDPLIDKLDNVYLYNIDDLQGVIDLNKEERAKEAERAEKIVEEEIGSFLKWTMSLSATPTIVALRNMAESIRQDELEKTLKALGPLEEKQIKAIEYLSNTIVNKLIHPPTIALKEEDGDKDLMVSMIKKLYGLETEENDGKEK